MDMESTVTYEAVGPFSFVSGWCKGMTVCVQLNLFGESALFDEELLTKELALIEASKQT